MMGAVGGMGRWFVAALIAALSSGCGEPAPDADGGTPPADGAVAGDVAPPAPPGPPSIACPEGWREASADGVTTCEPWPETGPPACVPGTMALPGVEGCAPLGAACSGEDLPPEPGSGGPFVYVLAGSVGGDGSRFAPFATIGEAMGFASPGSTLLIGRGTYDEAVAPKAGVTLQGVCPRLTVLTRTDTGAGEAVVRITQDGVTLRDLTVSGATRFFGVVARAGHTHLEGVILEDLGAPGIGAADAATVTVSGSVIRRCAHGIEAIAGGTVEVEASQLIDGAGPGVVAIGGAVTIRESWIADHRNVGEPGFGALAQDGGAVLVERSVVSGNADVGLTAGAGGAVEARDTLIEDQRSDPAGDAGFGVEAEAGGAVTLRGVTLRRNRMGAIFVQGEGTALDATDLLVLDTRARGDGTFGRGVVVQDGARATIARALVAQSRDVAVLVSGANAATSLGLQDVEIRDTQPQESDGEGGRGISAQHAATLELARVRVVRCLGVGIHVAGRDARDPTATVEDVEVADVAPEREGGMPGLHGRALQIEDGAIVTGERVRLQQAHEAALVVFQATAELRELAILDTRARAVDDTIGRGVIVQGGGQLTLEHAHVERTRDVAIYLAEAGSRLVARRLTVLDALARGCAETACMGAPGGHGVGVYDGAAADLTDFRIERAALCGAHVGEGASLDLRQGVVRGATIGACVEPTGYDLARLSADVRYEDNGANLESTTMPSPETVDGLSL